MAAQHTTTAVPTAVPSAAPPPRHHCKDCGLFFDSARSLDVHLHYHKDNLLSKWAAAPAPADASGASESNNNSLQHNGHHAPKSSPVGQGAFKAVTAPADSSDGAAASPAYSSPSPFGHAPPAPSPAAQQQQQQRFSPAFGYAPRGTPPPSLLQIPQQQQQQQQQHFASPAFTNFDLADAGPQGNFFTPPGTDNGQYILGPNPDYPILNNRNPSPVPAPYRYHPYAQPQSQQQQQPSQAQTPPSGTNGYDARVSSTSSQGASPAPPPPARSPQQCDKCGCLCGSSAGLAEHLRTAHPPTPFGGHPTPSAAAAPTPATAPGQPLFASQDIDDFLQQHVKREAHDPDVDTNSGAANTSTGDNGTSGDLLVSVKEEPAAEILDLDSHKVHQVYQEEEEQLQQQLQHHQLLWGLDQQQSLHPPPPPHLTSYAPHHVQYHPHQLAPRPAPAPFYATQHVSMDFGGAPHHLAPHPHAQQQAMFAPAAAGQRAFAPPSHMPLPHLQMAPLPPPPPPPNGAPTPGNSPAPGNGTAAAANSSNNASWKSNEARRPKTYNCSACNKWFTSSGHLKRHYNTTLHKNAVKQSGAPDPANANSTSSNSSNSSSIPAPHASPGPPGPGGGGGGGGGSGARDLGSPALSSPALSSPAALAEDSRPEDAMAFGRLTPQQQPPPPQPPPQQQQQAPPPPSQPSFIPFAQHQQLQQQQQQLHLQQQQQAQHQAQQQQQQHDFGPSVHLVQAPTHPALAQQPPYLMGASPPPAARAVPAQAAPAPAPAPFPNGLPPHVSSTPMPPATTSQLLLATSGSRSTTALPSFAHLAHGGSGIAAAAAVFGGGLALVSTSVPAAGNVGGLRSSPDDHLSRLRGGGGIVQGGGAAASRRASPDAGGASPFTALGLGDELRLPSDGGCGGADPDTDALDNNNHVVTNNNYSLTTLGPAAFDTGGSSLDGSTSSGGSVGSGGGLSPAPGPPPNPVRESRVSSSTPLVFKSSMISNGSIHKCLDCDKVFNKACYLTQHNKSFHAGEKPFKCKRCGKRFPEEPLYEEHCSKHAGDKPHKCAQCPKQFNHKTDLRRHLCLHTGDKPFACGVCGKGFIRKDHMLKHCETHRKKMLTAQPPLHAAPARTAAPLGV